MILAVYYSGENGGRIWEDDMKSINPATNQLIKEYIGHSDTETANIIDSVNAEYVKWSLVSFAERGNLMRNAANILRKNREQYARTMTLEMGKIISEARAPTTTRIAPTKVMV